MLLITKIFWAKNIHAFLPIFGHFTGWTDYVIFCRQTVKKSNIISSYSLIVCDLLKGGFILWAQSLLWRNQQKPTTVSFADIAEEMDMNLNPILILNLRSKKAIKIKLFDSVHFSTNKKAEKSKYRGGVICKSRVWSFFYTGTTYGLNILPKWPKRC